MNGGEGLVPWLYRGLRQNPQFAQRFAEHVDTHFFNGGALTDENILLRFEELRSEMAGALPDMDTDIRDIWVPERRGIVLQQFASQGLW